MLPQQLRAVYREKGWVCVPGVLSEDTVRAVREAVQEVLELSCAATGSTECFDVNDEVHSAAQPSLRKIKRPSLWHPAFNRVVDDPALLAAVGGLVDRPEGVGLRFQGDKVVVKMPRAVGNQPVVCHQDLAFYPHTNDDLCTVSVCVQDMSVQRGGLLFAPGSHRGPLFSHHAPAAPGVDINDCSSLFAGGIRDDRFGDPDAVEWDAVECPAGSIVVHHARTVHCSPANTSDTMRPLLLLQYAAADAWPLMQHPHGAWGIQPPTGHRLDEWTLYRRGLVSGNPTVRPRMATSSRVPETLSLPLPWPARGELGSLYARLDTVHAHVNLDAARQVTPRGPCMHVDGEERARGGGGAGAGGGSGGDGGGAKFRHLYKNNAREWQRLEQLVGAGPFGYYLRYDRIRTALQAALLRAVTRTPTRSTSGSGDQSTTAHARAGAGAGADPDTDAGERSCEGNVKEDDGEDDGGDDDDAVFEELHACLWNQVAPKMPEYAEATAALATGRSTSRAEEIVAAVSPVLAGPNRDLLASRCESLLDIGCADGHITAAIGRALSCPAEHTHGCDVNDDANMVAGVVDRHDGVQFAQVECASKLPYADAQFDLVVSLMTLHHVPGLRQTECLREIFRVLKPGGAFVLREHDCNSHDNARVLDLLHGLHYRAWSPAGDPNHRPPGWLRGNFRGHYHSAAGWHRLVTAAGLAPVERDWGGKAADDTVVTAKATGAGSTGRVWFKNPKRAFVAVYCK